jgi:hypothetical protein
MLGRDCMRRFGLDWPVIEGAPPDSNQPPHRRRYGLFDLEHAQQHGYHPDPTKQGGWEPVIERDATPEEMAVWAGRGRAQINGQPVPEGGCAGEAIQKLADGAPPPPQIFPEQLANEAHKRAEQHSSVREAMNRWSDCMKRRGFQYQTPSDANNDSRWHTNQPEQPEIETAKADVICKQESNLVAIWYGVEIAYQKKIIEEKSSQLEAAKAYNETIIRNAARYVAGR